jgi:predicted phosphohydrolase
MRLVFISDTHNHTDFRIPQGDVLVHAGDATGSGTPEEVDAFLEWFASQPHPHKIFIAGNHDWLFQTSPDLAQLMLAEHSGVTYLQDSGVVLDGVRFWGSPWQPWFNDWAFNLRPGGEAIRRVWNMIPLDTDVLITHGPPHGILDAITDVLPPLGCKELRVRLATVKPRIHAFGHIHGGYGAAKGTTTLYVNASTCDEKYRPGNRPIVVDLTAEQVHVLGTDPTPRRIHLDRVKAILAAASGQPAEIQAAQEQAGFQAMADLRGTTVPELLQDYGRRGLHADMKKLERNPDSRRERLDAIKAILDAAGRNPAPIRALQEQAILSDLAALQGRPLSDLLQEYARHGLRADLNNQEKAENKPGNRPIPLIFLKE